MLGEKTLNALKLSAVAIALAACASAATAAETGDLKIRFEYGAKGFTPKPVDVNKDVEFCGKHDLKDETLVVNETNQGLKNVVVYVYTGRGGSKLEKVDAANNTHVLANENCRFEPHILITQTGDTLKVTNPDPVGHNANINFFNNTAQNIMVPSGQEQTVKLEKEEPAPIPVDCNIHPWMKAYVVVLEHPFAAVSDENGELTIKGLPAGEKLTFRVYHEKGAINEVQVNGKAEDWKRSRFEVDIRPGENDLGTVVVPADALK
jgi:plastocyanin